MVFFFFFPFWNKKLFSFILLLALFFTMQTVFENSLMQHHVALPPDAMGKITYIAPAGEYSLKVCLSNFSAFSLFLGLVCLLIFRIDCPTYCYNSFLATNKLPLYGKWIS